MVIILQEVNPDAEFQLIEGDVENNEEIRFVGFLRAMTDLFDLLESFKVLLRDKSQNQLIPKAKNIVERSDEILAACHVFMDFIHPIWINVQRTNKVDEGLVRELSRKLNEKLEANKGKLGKEFDSLVEKHNLLH